MSNLKCFIFDLDGVIVDTAKYHFISWKWVCKELGIEFNEIQNEKLKGISRVDSLNLLLQWGGVRISDGEKTDWLFKKNEKYLDYVQKMSQDEVLPGVLDLIKEIKDAGKKIALGSASKNATRILDILDISSFFDAIVDGNSVTKSKPDPEVFLKGAAACGVSPLESVVFEDSVAGIRAAKSANCWAIGIGDPEVLLESDLIFPGFQELTLSLVNSRLSDL